MPRPQPHSCSRSCKTWHALNSMLTQQPSGISHLQAEPTISTHAFQDSFYEPSLQGEPLILDVEFCPKTNNKD